MKNNITILFISFILFFFGFQAILYAQTTDKDRNLALYEKLESLIFSTEKKRLSTSGFDIHGKVTDVDGNPLDEVRMTIDLSRPNIQKIVTSESKIEDKVINSDFYIQEKGWDALVITFRKKGYYVEQRSFSVDHLQRDASKRIRQETIQVKLVKKGKPADLFVLSDRLLKYDVGDESKTICDLSLIISSEGLEHKDYDNTIKMKKVKLGTKLDASKYFELDFPRDDHNNILLDSVHEGKPFPSSFIIRYHSDSPDDGMILIEVPDPNLTRPTLNDNFRKVYTIAPKVGYLTKEIIVKIGEKKPNLRYSSEEGLIFVYFKCGEHYGKAVFNPTYFTPYRPSEDKPNRFGQTCTEIGVKVNVQKSDRNLTIY